MPRCRDAGSIHREMFPEGAVQGLRENNLFLKPVGLQVDWVNKTCQQTYQGFLEFCTCMGSKLSVERNVI